MLPQRYRITGPTLAMFRDNEHNVVCTVLKGTLITVVDPKPFNGERLMEVEWDGRVVMMFTHDLRARSEKWSGD